MSCLTDKLEKLGGGGGEKYNIGKELESFVWKNSCIPNLKDARGGFREGKSA